MEFNEILRIILCTLPFIFLCLLNTKINLNRADRAMQFAMPVVTLVYVVVGVILLDKLNIKIQEFLLGLGQKYEFLDFLLDVPWDSYMIFVMNALFVLAFILLKFIVLPIISGIWRSSKDLVESTSGYFYEYEEDVDKWLFMKHLGNFRSYFKGIFYVFFFASVFVFILSQFFREEMVFQATFYPVFGILLFSEIVFFLDGITKREFVEDILGEDEESFKIANYGILRGILRDLYPDRVLHEGTFDTSKGISTDFDALDEMEKSEDKKLVTLAGYFKEMKASGKDVDINYIKSAIELLNGNSTLFGNPFYKDTTDYLMLPIIRQMISYKKCLIIVGRDAAAQDVKQWMDDAMFDFNNTNSLWKTKILDNTVCEDDIGILRMSDIYNLDLHRINSDFLSKVGFVILIEPSKILAAGQIGLSLLVNRFEAEDKEKKIVYCAFDRNCDGLVDALSHVLKTSITQVTATLSGGANCSHMCWNADGPYMHHKLFPNVSRYLGIGTELNAVGMKYQINDTVWLGSERFPVQDMKWIAGQYYKQICNYADMPVSQSEFDRVFNVSSNMWDYPIKENAYMVVEDEFRNLFEMTRVYASRAKNQCFINVISENYFLRDYMIDNVATFSNDPKAIPTIVPDYARTERNMVLKLIMMMANAPVSETVVEKELLLCGLTFEDPYIKLRELICKHCNVENPTLSVHFKEEILEGSVESAVVKQYEITESNELYEYSRLLKNAYYIAEDEEGEKHYIGSRLYGHVFQVLLPGQFMTYDGKYYEIQTVTSRNGVVVRRAADHITHRRYYRQIRNVTFSNWVASTELGSIKTEYDLEIVRGFADINVSTSGYYEMKKAGDIKSGKKVTINGIPDRSYRNKSVLRIRLSGASTGVRYTVALLLNEIFTTVYPDGYPYVCALTSLPEDSDALGKDLMYGFSGETEDGCIYIIEDSEIDLGLIVSVERNLRRFFEIITETLSWHTEKMNETPYNDEEPQEFTPEFAELGPQKKGVKEKVKDFFKRIFGRKKKEEKEKPVEKEPEENVPEELSADPFAEGTVTDAPPEEQDIVDVPGEYAPSAETEEAVEALTDDELTVIDADGTEADSDAEATESVGILIEEGDATSDAGGESDGDITPEADASSDEGLMLPGAGESVFPAFSEADPDSTLTEDMSNTSSEDDTMPALQNKIIPPSRFRDEGYKPADDTAAEAVEEELPVLDVEGEDEVVLEGDEALTDYQKNCYLKYGYDVIHSLLDIPGTIEYLSGYEFNKNPLQQARTGAELAAEYEKTYDPQKYGAHLCDFCGIELIGGEYELLKDGRERCNRCSMTAVKTGEEFKELYKNVLRNMETFYGIKLNVAIKVRMTDAKKIARHFGEKFVATPGFDGRTLGFAQKDKNGYCIYVENGSPKLAAMATIAHELTHIWQYLNWDDKAINDVYGKNNSLEVYEGMAKWAEIQYLILLNEIPYAKRQEIATRLRQDAYGQGFIKYAEKYPLSYSTKVGSTPFNENPPL